MNIRKITFNWEMNVGTILMLTVQCITLISFTAVLYYRFKGVEATVAHHTQVISSLDKKIGTIAVTLSERTGKPIHGNGGE